jgi:hypothetical protein
LRVIAHSFISTEFNQDYFYREVSIKTLVARAISNARRREEYSMTDETLGKDLSLGFFEAPKSWANDLEMLKLYQEFSAELLRIALLGLTALAAIIFTIIKNRDIALASGSRWFIFIATLFFGLAAAAALAHRYCSSDSMASHLEMLRYEKRKRDDNDKESAKKEEEARDGMFRIARWSLVVGAASLGLGAIAFAVGISYAVLSR